MNRIRPVVVIAVLTAALASCGGPTAPPLTPAPDAGATVPSAAAAPTTATPDPAADEEAVEASFNEYNAALAAEDFGRACALNAPESIETMLDAIEQQAGQRPTDCVEALEGLYSNPATAEQVDAIATTTEIEEVAVTGDEAEVTWSADVQGQRPTVTSDLRRVDGNWLLVDTG
ncbi:MAG: hypothetical protein AVDCRST_MAG66-3776 [uncultured Pseudonocardia sp.]|uniref:DUF4878 domain-containing protein n=1 Tax=uncultured Pseudonocardia sp. TaxID=211455 RepID=A0A6J4QBL0_9PSEU|nr:MAG: hypothetical protein AVDCRST_MAG66-3776 [uncultured Pseudonocardia sp.]